jgi:hypothetical protein
MAVNDFWGALANDPALVTAANPFLSPEYLKAGLLDIVGVGMTQAEVRAVLGIPTGGGTNRGAEFGDLISTLNNLGTGQAARQLKAYVVDKICSAARLSGLGGPYITGNALRLQARAVFVQELPNGAAGLVGTLVSAT